MSLVRDERIGAIVLRRDGLPPAFFIFPSFIFINVALGGCRPLSLAPPPPQETAGARNDQGAPGCYLPPLRAGWRPPLRHQLQVQREGAELGLPTILSPAPQTGAEYSENPVARPTSYKWGTSLPARWMAKA